MGMLENGKIAYVDEKPDLMPGNSFPDRARLPFHAPPWARRCWRTGSRRITYGWRRAIVSGRRRNGTPRTVTARVMSILSAFSKEHPILGLSRVRFRRACEALARCGI